MTTSTLADRLKRFEPREALEDLNRVTRDLKSGESNLQSITNGSRRERRDLVRTSAGAMPVPLTVLTVEERLETEGNAVAVIVSVMRTAIDPDVRRRAANDVLRHLRRIAEAEAIATGRSVVEQTAVGQTINQLIVNVEHGTPVDVIAQMLLDGMPGRAKRPVEISADVAESIPPATASPS